MVDIRPFDPHSATRAEWSALHAFRRARNAEDAPDDVLFDDTEFERQTRHRWPLYEDRRWYAWDGGEIGAGVGVSFRREGTDNYADHAAYVYAWGGVRVHRRRLGIATDLLRPLLRFMHERNKTIATFETILPEGNAFLAAIGATLKHQQIESRVPLGDLDWTMLARWHDAVVYKNGPLHWEIHPHRVPRDRMDVLGPQFESLAADMPIGDLEIPPTRTELSAWLAWYEDIDRHGGDHSLVILMEGDVVAAVCETSWDARFPDRIYQKLTAVARRWRGRGFAKGVKAVMMRLIRDRHPDIRFIITSSDNVNAPILSINTRLGFAEHRRTATYQIGPEAIAGFLRLRDAAGARCHSR